MSMYRLQVSLVVLKYYMRCNGKHLALTPRQIYIGCGNDPDYRWDPLVHKATGT
jgi:hypothetical protein